MRILSGPELAIKVSEAGGLGFIGPGAQPEHLNATLNEAKELLKTSSLSTHSDVLPFGVGFQTWAGDLRVATESLRRTSVAAVWLFAPRHGQDELDEWTEQIRQDSPGTQIWIQVASVKDAIAAATSKHRPDVLVIQGTDAGGHSLKQGAGIITLLPEVADAMEDSGVGDIPLVAAGGISDARGAAASLALGASGITLGTRLLASNEATINPGYRSHILTASDGGQTTVRTQLYNHLRGTTDWPEAFDARGLMNQSWRDHVGGMGFEEIKNLHAEAVGRGNDAWGEKGRTATYAGTGVGLVREVKGADEIVREVREGIVGVLEKARSLAG
jgi:nitronate monooxygenase